MKIVKECIKNYRILVAFSLLAVIFSVEIKAMGMSKAAIQYSKNLVKRKKEAKDKFYIYRPEAKDKFYIYQPGIVLGVYISSQVAEKSGLLTHMIGIPGADVNKKIATTDMYPINQVRVVRDVIQNWLDQEKEKKTIEDLPLKDLISRVNILENFVVERDIVDLYLKKTKVKIDDGRENIDELKGLNDDVQKSLLVASVPNNLKNIIMRAKNMDIPDAVIKKYEGKIISLVFAPDGKAIAVSSSGELTLCDISNLTNITYQVLTQDINSILPVVFSLDSSKIAAAFLENIIVWDRKTLKKIDFKSHGHIFDAFSSFSLAFSPDGKKIAVGGVDSIKLWDIDTLENIECKPPEVAELGFIHSLSFSQNGKRMVLGGSDSFILWDNIDDLRKTAYYLLGSQSNVDVNTVALNSDGSKIIADFGGSCTLLDIADLKDIKPKSLMKLKRDNNLLEHHLLGFSSDGNQVLLLQDKEQESMFTLPWQSKKRDKVLTSINISDLENIRYQSLKIADLSRYQFSNVKIAVSSDGNKIALESDKSNVNLFVFLTDNQMKLINDIKSYDLDKLRLLYKLCSYKLKNQPMAASEYYALKEAFKTLPQPMQELLRNLGLFR